MATGTQNLTSDKARLSEMANKLTTPHTFKVELDSTNASTGFDGTADIHDIGVDGLLQIANGGTNASTAAGARANLGTWALVSDSYNTIMPADGTTNAWYKFGTSNTSYGILPSASGGATAGHNYIGTSSWYWKYSYIDEMNCTRLRIIHNSSNNGDDAVVYLENKNSSDWGMKINCAGANYGLNVDVTAGAEYGIQTNGCLRAYHVKATSGYLYSTANSNTVTIGSQNNGWCHIYNSANIPFIFNKTVCSTSGDCGHASYPWNSVIVKAGGRVHANGGALYLGNANNASWVYVQDMASHSGTNKWAIHAAGSAEFYGTLTTNSINCGYITVRAGGGVEGGEICLAASSSGYTAYLDIYQARFRVWASPGNRECLNVYLNTGTHSDYAEEVPADSNEPGRVYKEQNNCILTKANKRLISGCSIISDTHRMCIGNIDKNGVPVAVAGRVLVYPYQDRNNYQAGMAVCSAPNGTVDIMTREEIKEYPDCILGYVAGIPDPDTWPSENVPLKGRIWIRLA